MDLTPARQDELDKYTRVYANHPKYVVSSERFAQTKADLMACPMRGSLLEVGCGPGVLLDLAESLGFGPTRGIEMVAQCCDGKRITQGLVHELPFDDEAFDVCCMFDVIEHLLPGDDKMACEELFRVANRHILISASNRTSIYDGIDLHINKRDYADWQKLFELWMPGKINLMRGRHRSPMWRIDL